MDDYKKIIEKLMIAIELWIENLEMENICVKKHLDEIKFKEEKEEWHKEEYEAFEEMDEVFDWEFQSEHT